MAGDIVDYLPLDIVFRILLWLPVSSLLRFKSVCKFWLSLIESSDFVHKQIRLTSLHDDVKQTKLLLVSRTDKVHKKHVSLYSVHDKSELLLDFPVIHDPYQINYVKMVASCNGIICLQQERRLCLWNPATKQCTNLPPLPVFSVFHCIGFGFDFKADDYKLASISIVNDHFVFHIYSSNFDSWRKIEAFAPPDMRIQSDINAPYRNGIYCWLASTDRGKVVYTFDFSDEVFGIIPLPSGIDSHALFILRENIACLVEVTNDVNGWSIGNMYYEIWMLSDYQVKESWTKLYSIESISDFVTWAACLPTNGDFLLFRGTKLCLYDLVSREVMNLPVRPYDGLEAVMYKESLLSIKRGNGATNGVTRMDLNGRILISQSMTGNKSCGGSVVHYDVVFQVLLRLPVVSLLRFKTVCKSWHSLIKSSDFVAKHLFLHHHHQDKINNFNIILHSSTLSYDPLFEDSSHNSPNASCTCLLSADKLELLDLPFCFQDFGCLYITASFNGIICLKHSEGLDVYLWNPVTKQFRVVFEDGLSYYGGEAFRIGFGFDGKTNEYKLVRFDGRVVLDLPHIVQVYSLSTDSWRTIDDEILPTVESIHSGLDAPYRNEIYCWLAGTYDTTYPHTILSFDFSNEVFGTIPLPDSINKSSHTLVLTIMRENISCVSLGEESFLDDTENWHCEIWLMNEYGVKESWVKLYTVRPFSKDWCFKMYYSKKNADYILLLKDGQLHEYNLVTHETKRLPVQFKGPKQYQVVAFKESLVPIKRGSC